MRNISSRVKLDIVAAVNSACNEIHVGAVGFFVDTEFGYIPIQVFHHKPTMTGSYTTRWEDAPATKWVMENRNGKYNWYVSINYIQGQDKVLTKMQLIKEFSSIMYRSLNHDIAPKDIDLETLVNSYIHSFYGYGSNLQTDRYAKEYVNATGGIAKIIKSSRAAMESEVINHLKTKKELANINNDRYMQKLKDAHFSECDFGNNFYDLMFIMTMSGTGKDELDKFNELFIKVGSERIYAYDLLKLINK